MSDVPIMIMIDDIIVNDGRRELNSASVKRLAQSIEQVGLRHPITVKRKGEKYLLIAGRHRLEACKKIGREHIAASIVSMNNDEARLWEIAENLHRAELSNIERAESIEEWRQITERVSNRLTPHGGKQPSEAGYRKTAEALGISHETVRNSEKIAKIDPDAKRAATQAGTTSVRELVEVAKEPPSQQAAKVHELAVKRASSHPKDDHERSLEWRRSFERVWNQSPSDADREWARTWIDNPIMDERYGS